MGQVDRASAGSGCIVGVVLAAGKATRLAGNKVTRPVAGQPMVERVVNAALGSRLTDTLVVVGHEADKVRQLLHGYPVRTIHNQGFLEGLSTSMQAGLRAAGRDCEAVMFILADQPFLTSALIDQLIDAFVTTGKAIVRPVVDGRPANPVIFGASLFPELLQETGDRGGRSVIRRHPDEVSLLAVDDARVCMDVDSLAEYEKVRNG